MSGIEHRIAELQDEAVEPSSGVFTLSPERSAEQFAAFQKANPSFWLLRLFQALESGGCQQVALRIKRGRIEIEVEGGQLLDPNRLLQVDGKNSCSDLHFRAAMLALLSTSPQRIDWNRNGQQFRHAKGESTVSQVAYRGSGQLIIDLNRNHAPNETAELHLTASRRLGWGKARLKLDGRVLVPDWPTGSGFNFRGIITESYLANTRGFPFPNPELEHYRESGGAHLWAAPGTARLKSARSQTLPSMVIRRRGMGSLYTLVVGLALAGMGGQEPTKLYGVRDGILLEEDALKLGSPRSIILVDASELKVDASGLKLVHDEAFFEMVAQGRLELISSIDSLLPHVEQVPDYLRSALQCGLARSPNWIPRILSRLVPTLYDVLTQKSAQFENLGLKLRQHLEEQKRALQTEVTP